MDRLLLAIVTLALNTWAGEPVRPKITGIDHVSFYTTEPKGVAHLYANTLALPSAEPVEPQQTARYMVGKQWVGYSAAPAPEVTNRLDHIAFTTTSLESLQRYLTSRGVALARPIRQERDGSRSFAIKDPDGFTVEFVQRGPEPKPSAAAVSRRLIHLGIIVQDRGAADRFYRDLLGFRLYWHGGMKPERTDWVAMQVPDGTDWLEYMLNQPAALDPKTSGVMNHISLGVEDMKQAEAQLVAHGWTPHGDEHSQMGLDGKRQLNLFDPDWSRVELMDFRPVQKPCCSDFQGPHPSETR